MCFFSSPKASAPAPAPLPAPSPMPVAPTTVPIEPTTVSSQTADQRRKQIAMMRQGLMSTIRTSPRGLTGQGVDLTASAATGGKTTLGG